MVGILFLILLENGLVEDVRWDNMDSFLQDIWVFILMEVFGVDNMIFIEIYCVWIYYLF